MTDRYAIRLYETLFLPKAGRSSDQTTRPRLKAMSSR